MSAIDDLIARDAGASAPAGVDAIIARDAGPQAGAPQQAAAPPTQPAAGQPSTSSGGFLSSLLGVGDAQMPSPNAQPAPTGGFLTGVGDAVKGTTQGIAHGLSWAADKIAPNSQFATDARAALPQMQTAIDSQNQQYEAQRAANGQSGIDWSRMAGNAAGTAPLAFAAPEMGGASVLGRTVVGAGMGAANAALQPVTDLQPGQSYADQKLGQMGLGAVSGGISAPLTSMVASGIRGLGGAAQQRLADAGVSMTPGQILGGGFARTEDKLTSVPVLGDLIKNAQQRATQSFNTATYNQVLAPLGQKYSGPVGNEGVQAVQNTISNAYDNALSKMTFKATDPAFQSDMSNLVGLAQNLPAAQQQTFMNVLKTQVMGKLGPQGEMDGPTLKGAQSELSRIARGYAGDPSFDNRQLGQAVGEIKSAIDNSLPRYNAPDAVQGLANANSAYANFVRLRGAAASQGAMNNGGVFTAGQLQNSVKAADKSVGKGATATGNALMQDLSSAGQSVLGSKYPDSGTAGRSLLGLAAGAAAGHAFLPPGVMAPAAVGISAAALPYTTYGQKLAQGLLMSRPAGAVPVGNALSRYGVPLAPTLSAALLQAVGNAK